MITTKVTGKPRHVATARLCLQSEQVLREQGLIVTIHGRGTFVGASLRSGTDQTD